MPKKSAVKTEEWGPECLELLKKVPRTVDGVRYTYPYIQEVIKAKYNVSVSVNNLRYYRSKYIDALDKLPPTESLKQIEKRAHKIDIAVERVRMIKMMENRIYMDMKIEHSMGKLLKDLNKEFIARNIMLNDLKQDYIDLGIIEPPTINRNGSGNTELSKNFQEAIKRVKELKNAKPETDTPSADS